MCMKSIDGRLSRQEKAKQGDLWDWVRSKMGEIQSSFTLRVQDS